MNQRTEDIISQSVDLIEQSYQRGYKAGYSKAENDYYAKTEDDRKATYELGLDMAWEAARKLVLDVKDGGLSSEELESIFSPSSLYKDLLKTWSASEVIETLRAYEEKKTQDANTIKVGDEVILNDGDKAVVTEHHSDVVCVVRYDGCTSFKFKDDIEKTGRHFPEIAEVLKKMQEN